MCKLCGCAGVEKYDLLRCVGANCVQPLHVNRDSTGYHRGAAYCVFY